MSAGSAGQRVLVLGGTSEIALAIVRELQTHAPREVALVGRDPAALRSAAEDLRASGCLNTSTFELDALDTDRHGEVIAQAFAELGGSADIVILAVGMLGERGGGERGDSERDDGRQDGGGSGERGGDSSPFDVAGAVQTMRVNLVGAGSLLLHSARELRDGQGGAIVVLSSVAAERPRRANPVYGASKAGLDALAQALGDELHEQGVRMLVVRPGFVHTRMTRGLHPAPLASTPQAVARVVVDGLDRGAHTVWAPGALRWLMLVMRMLPRSLFRRIKR